MESWQRFVLHLNSISDLAHSDKFSRRFYSKYICPVLAGLVGKGFLKLYLIIDAIKIGKEARRRRGLDLCILRMFISGGKFDLPY